MNKIVFFIGSLGGGGAERVTIQLADYFCNKGCKVYFLAFSKENSNYIVNKNKVFKNKEKKNHLI